MLQDPIGTYEMARARQQKQLERARLAAQRRAAAPGAIRPGLARALRWLADRVEGCRPVGERPVALDGAS